MDHGVRSGTDELPPPRRRHKTNSAPADLNDILSPKVCLLFLSETIFYPPKNLGSHSDCTVQSPFYRTATFWKRFAVLASIVFSVASLVMGAFVSLTHLSAESLRGLYF